MNNEKTEGILSMVAGANGAMQDWVYNFAFINPISQTKINAWAAGTTEGVLDSIHKYMHDNSTDFVNGTVEKFINPIQSNAIKLGGKVVDAVSGVLNIVGGLYLSNTHDEQEIKGKKE